MTTEQLYDDLNPILLRFVHDLVQRDDTAPMSIYAACSVFCFLMTALREDVIGNPALLTLMCQRIGLVPNALDAFPAVKES